VADKTSPVDHSPGVPQRQRVCAVVVTFDPDEELMRRLTIVREQVDGLVVVDNSLSASRREVVAQAVAATGATLVSNPQNLGIAAALNQGASRALESGYEWLLMLDQDTWPEPFMIDELARAYQACPFRDRLAIVGSAVPETQSYAYCRGRSWAEQEAVITSGSLLRLEAFQRGGPFREDFFIDYVDLEYCLRMRSLGYRVILTCRPTMQHHIGHPRRHRLVYRDVTPTHHSPLRRYYITRNRIVVWRQYARTEPRFVAWDAVACVKEAIKLLFFERDRGAKARAMARGVRDALAGRLGPAGATTTPAPPARVR
jgi:rhamnosyltransferase